jgi:hypothetical protein
MAGWRTGSDVFFPAKMGGWWCTNNTARHPGRQTILKMIIFFTKI